MKRLSTKKEHTDSVPVTHHEVVNIPLDQIHRLENSRIVHREGDIAGLMASIKQHGLMQPVGVRKMKKGAGYELVFGNRRFMAMEKLGRVEIPVILLDSENKLDFLLKNLTENMQRKNLTPFEEGRYFLHLEKHGLTRKEIAVRLDVSPRRVMEAITVFSKVPKEFHADIANAAKGKRLGTITAAIASKVVSAAKTHNLSQKETKEFLTYAKKNKVDAVSVNAIGGMMKQGKNIEEAISSISTLKNVNFAVTMPIRTIHQLEKKYGYGIHSILVEYLRSNPEFQISPRRDADSKKQIEFKLTG